MSESLTPHGPGFRFIDRFELTSKGGGIAWKFLDPESPFFADHFPGRPMMPAVLLTECAAQAAGTAWMYGSHCEPGTFLFLASIDRFRIRNVVAPGATVRTEVEMMREMGTLAQFSVRCVVDEMVVAEGHLTLSLGVDSPQNTSNKPPDRGGQS